MNRIPMTTAGEAQLRQELKNLKTDVRRDVVKAIAEARAHGDLRENAEYAAAREQQSFIEGRIKEIEAKLSHAQVIDVSKLENMGKVIFGSTVHLVAENTDKHLIYRIVGEDEADIKHGKISFSSPVARALIGKQEGDSVEVNTPSGLLEYYIDRVEYI